MKIRMKNYHKISSMKIAEIGYGKRGQMSAARLKLDSSS